MIYIIINLFFNKQDVLEMSKEIIKSITIKGYLNPLEYYSMNKEDKGLLNQLESQIQIAYF